MRADPSSDPYEPIVARLSAQLDAGDVTGAVAAIQAFIAEHPQHTRALGDLGVLCFQARRFAAACEAFAQVVALEPENDEARRRLDTARARAADESPAASLDATPGNMQVDEIAYDTQCAGPIRFHVSWTCGACAGTNVFQRTGTLLPPEVQTCATCGTQSHYRYDGRRHQPDAEMMRRLAPLEDALFDIAGGHRDEGLELLGLNLTFPMMSHLANLVRGQGRDE